MLLLQDNKRLQPRREFLATTLTAIAATVLPYSRAACSTPGPITIQQVIDALLADIPGAPFPQTVDTIKAGDPAQPVKGIVTTMFATDAIIQQAIKLNANFIIAHEPTFYNHLDETAWLGDDPVLRFKRDLLNKHGIVVWRFHDGIHEHKPDGIRMGTMQAMGWAGHYDAANPPLVVLPSDLSLFDLITRFKKGLGIKNVKYIGGLAQRCSRVVLAPGAAGGREQIGLIQQYQPDVVVCGEINEWETSEYVRDARYQGRRLSLIVLGHSVSEEAGMEWLVPVLQKKIPGVQVTHLSSGDAFATI